MSGEIEKEPAYYPLVGSAGLGYLAGDFNPHKGDFTHKGYFPRWEKSILVQLPWQSPLLHIQGDCIKICKGDPLR